MAVWSKVKSGQLVSSFRWDPEYYQPANLKAAKTLAKSTLLKIDDIAYVTDGIHASPDIEEDGGVRYLSAKCVKDNEFILGDALNITAKQHANNPRTSLRTNDVLITTVGTIGNSAVVQEELLPANADRHLGIIRISDESPVDPYFLATFLNSFFGRFQTVRESTGNVQLNLFIEKIRELLVPTLPCIKSVSEQTQAAYHKQREAKDFIASAESRLVSALGLEGLDLSPTKCYARNFKEMQAEERFDAEYFNPKYQRLIRKLREDGLTLADVCDLSQRKFTPQETPGAHELRYIEIGSLTGDGEAEPEVMPEGEAPSRATWIVKPGDIITSLVRPIRRLSAIIHDEQDGCVCSSGFAVLSPKSGHEGIEPEVLLTCLRLPLICELLDLNTTASMYPAIPTPRLMRIPIKLPDKATRKYIIKKVRDSMTARREAAELLEQAKQEVEQLIAGKGKRKKKGK